MVINPKIAKLDTSYYRRRCRVGAPPFVEAYNFFFFYRGSMQRDIAHMSNLSN